MQTLLRRYRSPLIAIVALVFSAGIAMAAQPAGSAATGLANASTHAGKTVPAQATDESAQPDESSEPDASPDDANSSDSANNCSTDPTNLTPEELAALTHGSIVCWAAHQPTPDGYANHGAWVSHWARMNKGADAAAAGQNHKPSH
ncbi:MAG: hypothetical protein HY263_09945 [Chloroflexi bacterium]|nr:hypothetical protein [Chloroflexota bacterium]